MLVRPPIMAHSFLPYFKRIKVMFISCSGYGGAPQFPPLFPYPVLEPLSSKEVEDNERDKKESLQGPMWDSP